MGDFLQVTSAILDGEIVCLDDHGKPKFSDLLLFALGLTLLQTTRLPPSFTQLGPKWCDPCYIVANRKERRINPHWPRC